MYNAKIIEDSLAESKHTNAACRTTDAQGRVGEVFVRLTTIEATFPRFILAEMNTHKMISKNSASSRAIPVKKRIEQIEKNPFVPEAFGKNKSGMQAEQDLDEESTEEARQIWLDSCSAALEKAKRLVDLGVHKQHANRILEPYAWHTAILTATEWENFFNLRCHPAAQPEMQKIARMMKDAFDSSKPKLLEKHEWHLPYVSKEEKETFDVIDLKTVSVARCAAVSYERQATKKDIEDCVAKHNMLKNMGHWSPFEHQAFIAGSPFDREPFYKPFYGNFRSPWVQYRKTFPGEAVFRENG